MFPYDNEEEFKNHRFYKNNDILIEVNSNIDVQSWINIVVNRESIMSVIDKSVISIPKDDFIGVNL